VHLSAAHFVRSLLTLGAAQILTWVGGAAMAILLPRFLGDANLGKIAFGLAFTALVGLIADLGTATYLTREVARAPRRVASFTVNTLYMRFTLGVLSVCAAIVGVSIANLDALSSSIVYVLCGGMVAIALSNALVAALQGLQQIKALALFSIVTKLGYAGMAAAVLFGGAGPMEVAAAWVTSQMLGLVLVAICLVRAVGRWPRLRPDWSIMRVLFLGGLPFFLWQAALLVYGQVDAVLLSFLTQDAVVGWYSAAYRIVTIPLFLPTIIMTVIFPALSAASSEDVQFATIARRAIHIVLLPSVPMVLGIMLLSDKLIAFMGYPDAFTHSVVPMVLLAPHIVLVGVNMVVGTVLQTRDRQRSWALAAVAAAILNPALNFPAIALTQAQFGNGAIGASVVTTLTEVFMLGAGVYLLPRGVLGIKTVTDAARCCAAALVMAVVVAISRELPLLGIVSIGATAYAASALALGAVSLGEVRQVFGLIVRRDRAPQYELAN
jgi:O-antigen/teichoic acid export membrane protein